MVFISEFLFSMLELYICIMKNIRNIVIAAHVDAGKTTITENLLFRSGSIRSLGDVNKGTAQTDSLNIEKERGISIRNSNVSFTSKNGIKINIIDTPGHADFSSETEKAIFAADAALLVISAIEGVQSHTETIWENLQKTKTPTVIFINKIDREGADTENVLDEIKNVLTKNIICLQSVNNEGYTNASLNDFWFDKDTENSSYKAVIERIAESDNDLLEEYLNNFDLDFEKVDNQLKKLIERAEIFPVILGSAKTDTGISAVEKIIEDYIAAPSSGDETDFSGFVYKIEHDKTLGKLSHVRIFSGEIKSRDSILNIRENKLEKVAQLRKNFTQKAENINIAATGDTAILTGLWLSKAGDFLGTMPAKKFCAINETGILTVKAKVENSADLPVFFKAFDELSDEDPGLMPQRFPDLQELQIKIRGKLQIEILSELIQERFGIAVIFEKPSIIYKETPLKRAEGYVRYWMPKPCWAIMKFIIEPGEKNSGVIYNSQVSVDKIKQRYQNQIEESLAFSLKQGLKGWEVTDLKITLIDGEDHEVHTHPHDFTVATPMAIMNGLQNSGTSYMEPVLSLRITAPEAFLGNIAGDLTNMRANFGNPEFENGNFILKGDVPASESIEYPTILASKTGGKAKISLNFAEYRKCDEQFGVETPYRGISPADTQKYILHKRKAL